MLRADMPGRTYQLLLWCLLLSLGVVGGRAAEAPAPLPVAAPKKIVRVVVIPVREEIGSPVLYIVRRGLKEASKDDLVVIDMKTLGGGAGTALEIMEALDKFGGASATFVNDEAISAGAFIAAVTDEIYFSPRAVIGAAAAVTGEGKDLDETMRLKFNSYLEAKINAFTEKKKGRAQVITAMFDKDFELKIGDVLIKAKGKLLGLSATQAAATYGTPPEPLLSAGTVKSLDELLDRKLGAGNYRIDRLEVTWSEQLAVWLNAISPVLLGLGLLALFIEFKTPGFGIFGISGIVLLALVFLGSYVAGFSGHEPILIFAVGLVFVAVEIFFFPGIAILAVTGLMLMLGSLVWSMADLWPNEPVSVAWSGDVFVRPLQNVGLGVALSVGLALALLRFLPHGWFWDKLILGTAVTSAAQNAGGAPEASAQLNAIVGQRGVAATALRPSGQVEVAGMRYEAKVEVGAIDAGTPVVVRGRTDFGLIVEKADV